jgi:hypothetical protein
MVENDTKKVAKVANNFYCEYCDYSTSKSSDYDKHLLTSKHKNGIQLVENDTKMSQEISTFKCVCNKEYKYSSGYYRHKKNCLYKENTVQKTNENNNAHLVMQLIKENNELKNSQTDKNLILMLISENKELKTLMLEQQNMMMKVIENGTHNNNNSNNTTNSHNKAFNLNFFLNETCKDAMNIGEFVDSLKLQLSDLEKVGESGYIEGISSIIVKNLKQLDVTKRPVHCTDKKRETIYIKDENKWEKDEDRSKMHKLIKKVAFKNANMFAKFKEEHPDCMKYHSVHNDKYNKIVYESMGGKGDNDFEKNEKIIKNVLKEVIVDKNI